MRHQHARKACVLFLAEHFHIRRQSVHSSTAEEPCSNRWSHRFRRGAYSRLVALKITKVAVAACGAERNIDCMMAHAVLVFLSH
jgi:hypothetical protein